jgi:hypothetical protein
VVTVADGVVNLVRSLAAQEGWRVRVNAVLTEAGPPPNLVRPQFQQRRSAYG